MCGQAADAQERQLFSASRGSTASLGVQSRAWNSYRSADTTPELNAPASGDQCRKTGGQNRLCSGRSSSQTNGGRASPAGIDLPMSRTRTRRSSSPTPSCAKAGSSQTIRHTKGGLDTKMTRSLRWRWAADRAAPHRADHCVSSISLKFRSSVRGAALPK